MAQHARAVRSGGGQRGGMPRRASLLNALLARREAVVLALLLAIAGGVWAFVEIADEVREGKDGKTLLIDERVLLALRRTDDPSLPIGPEWLHNAAIEVTSLGSIAVLLLVIAGVLGYLAIRRVWGAFFLVLAASAGGEAANVILKRLFDRPRPDLVPHLTHVSTPSFPSGHAMLSAIIYLTLGALLARLEPSRRLKVYILAVALLLTGLVGVTRVYLGVHYPTDVLAGWCVGLSWALLCWVIARWLQHRGTIETPAAESTAD